MRHQVRILENDLHRLARLHGEAFLVVEHLIGDGADAQHADAEFAELLADRLRLVRRKLCRQAVAKLQGIEHGRRRSLGRRHFRDVGENAVEQRLRFILGPVARRDALANGLDRGMAVGIALHEFGECLEGAVLPARGRW